MDSSDEPRGPADPLICRGLLVHFKAVFEVLCSVAKAGISSCLISPPTNFNNYMVPHQHPEHVDPPNQTHLKHSILELMHSGFFFYFYLHRLITLIFPSFLKTGAPNADGKSYFTRRYCEIDFVIHF